MPQPTLQQLFAASSRKGQEKQASTTINSSELCISDACKDRAAAAGAAGGGSTGQHASVQQSKENEPVVHSAAGALTADVKPQQPIQSDGALAAKATSITDKTSSKFKQQSRTTQLYLDLGQRDFGASRCSVCGMVYTKGHQEDEKLHKAYHQGAVQGFKFQGWPQERVLLSEVAQGRLLMVLQTDPANHVKKVRELCAYVEKAHGMAPGWLLSAPQARVFMYVSSQRRVVGLAVVEPLKRAYRVMAPEGSQEQEVDSEHTVQLPAQPQQAGAGSLLGAAPAMQQQQQVQKRQSQDLLWPGLRKRGRLAALGRAAGSVGNTPLSLTSPGSTSGATPSCNLKAGSCPTSLLAAAGRMQVQTESSGQTAAREEAAAAAAAEPVVQQPSSRHAAAGEEGSQQNPSLLSLSQPPGGQESLEMQQDMQVQQQDVQMQQEMQPAAQLPGQHQAQQPAVDEASQLMPPPPPQLHMRQQQQQQQSDAASIPGSSGPVNSAVAATAGGSSWGAAGAGSSGGAAGAGGSGGVARAGSSGGVARAGGSGGAARAGGSGDVACAGGSGGVARAGSSRGAARAGSSGDLRRTGSMAADGSSGGRSLLVDQHKAVRAMVGVRVVWVSPEQRRRGLATKLLDAARCNMVPAYVVPCREVAFSQPSGDGVALAAAFAGTQQFLVYGID